jgi:hypothetical protein
MVFSVPRDVFRCNKNPLARQRELFALHASEPLPVSFGVLRKWGVAVSRDVEPLLHSIVLITPICERHKRGMVWSNGLVKLRCQSASVGRSFSR